MNYKKEKLFRLEWTLILTLVLCVSFMLNAYGELAENRVIRRSKGKVPFQLKSEKVLLVYGNRAVLRTPKFNSCSQFWADITGIGGKPDGYYRCNQLDIHTFLIAMFANNKYYHIRFIKIDNKTKVSTARFLLLSPSGHRRVPHVWIHRVASTGPGWVDLRFQNRHSIFPQMYAFLIRYERHTFNTMNDVHVSPAHEMAIVSYSDWSQPHLTTTTPLYPCPEWRRKKLYCVVISDFIRPPERGGRRYSDYTIQIYNTRVVPYLSYDRKGNSEEPYDFKIEKKDNISTLSVVYKCVVRIWDLCDPTGYLGPKCPPIMKPLQKANDVVKDSTDYGEYYSETEEPESDLQSGTLRKSLLRKPVPYIILLLRSSWPFWALLSFVLLFCFLPVLYIHFKRRAMYRAMENWYCWSSPDGKMHYLIALPGGIPERKMAKRRTRKRK